jgi:Uma2 family endonuclease
MDILIRDPSTQRAILRQRANNQSDRWDEVWEGVYVVSPQPNDEHQEIATLLASIFAHIIDFAKLGKVRAGVNVTDRKKEWKQNYRCPDVAVFLNGTTAVNLGTRWLGGPDFVVEVVSKGDSAREKLDFYAKVGVRELLLVDRFPWALELYRLEAGLLNLVGTSDPSQSQILTSEALPLTFRLIPGEPRPRIEVAHSDGVQRWMI